MTVEVCEADDCVQCGQFKATGNGKWASVSCAGKKGDTKGVEGSHVKIVAPKTYLQIAQVKILGAGESDLNYYFPPTYNGGEKS